MKIVVMTIIMTMMVMVAMMMNTNIIIMMGIMMFTAMILTMIDVKKIKAGKLLHMMILILEVIMNTII